MFHCYGRVDYFPANADKDGARVESMYTGRLSATSGNFTTNELWYRDTVYASWVETGWHVGARVGSTNTGLAWFWAEDNPSNNCVPYPGGYVEHYDFSAVNLGEAHEPKLSYSGNYKIGVYFDLFFHANSHPCFGNFPQAFSAGGETNGDGSTATGTAVGLDKRTAATGQWSSNWGNSTTTSLENDSPWTISWISGQAYYAAQYSAN
jgi:hypothetical protein